ncbi:hypothetical protein [Paeniglutamicibacter kerguelensis]|uniref:Uncharacterized protein n=1 Tax=Paeniglutamicibacter kerguelensis TaxID=254788 RepID=A0ABS4X928_9MICC|nr:hypothetical protein [Paeniglutamicibacter kerguelensis]MBP2384967.1 hypothetical protein [Paeniglutamicibacter kerguelensis]
MNNSKQTQTGARYAWIGFAMGIACMAGMFNRGLAIGQPGLVVMSSSLAAVLGATWSTTHVALKMRTAK